jgi:sRNA-binding regulator protein Hfq
MATVELGKSNNNKPPRDLIKVVSRPEKEEFRWLLGRLDKPLTVLFYSGAEWKHCKFVRLHTFSIALKNADGAECLIFKHAVAAIVPELKENDNE